jgi:hypothetical protein
VATTTPTFSFTSSDAAATLQCRVDAAAFAACSSPYTTAALAQGAHTFEVRATDAAGNAATATRSFTVDTVAPTVTITAGPIWNTGTVSFQFATSGATSTMCRMWSLEFPTPAFAACSSPYTGATFSGEWRFEVRATDAAGNSATASRDFCNCPSAVPRFDIW